jgi:3-hydroxybutyryl-CoA dehydrogenase
MKWNKIGILGAGTMGQAIAEMLAKQGLEVYILEKTQEQLVAGFRMMELSLDKQIEKWALTQSEKKSILNRIHAVGELADLTQCCVIIEAITEDIAAKQQLFQQLSECVSAEVIVATNTSTFSITELAAFFLYPQQVIGLHFIFPVSTIHIVEVIRGLQTSDDTFMQIKQFVEQQLNHQAILIYDSPGFVTTRLINTLINEAIHVLSEGVASAHDIDHAMRIGYQFRHGPLEMADRFGLDAVLNALERMFREYGDVKYRPAVLLRKMVRAGQLGTKSGAGFFRYDEDGDRI